MQTLSTIIPIKMSMRLFVCVITKQLMRFTCLFDINMLGYYCNILWISEVDPLMIITIFLSARERDKQSFKEYSKTSGFSFTP